MDAFRYPIKAVSKLTGLSVHTLHAWERRYQAVTPSRDDRGRLYSESDVERLRLLNAAVENGHSIGRIASMDTEKLRELIITLRPAGGSDEVVTVAPYVEEFQAPRSVMDAVLRLDYAAAERELGLLAGVLPPRDLVYRVALPIMKDVGELWHSGRLSVAQEHMTSALLSNLLGGLISHHHRNSSTNKILFATPSGERHEFGLLVAAMLAASAGMGIVYLGSDLPSDEILSASAKIAPKVVVLGFVGANGAQSSLKEIKRIAANLSAETELWIGGTKDEAFAREINLTKALMIDDFGTLERNLSRLGGRF